MWSFLEKVAQGGLIPPSGYVMADGIALLSIHAHELPSFQMGTLQFIARLSFWSNELYPRDTTCFVGGREFVSFNRSRPLRSVL